MLNQVFEVMTLTEKGNDDLTMPKLPVHIQDLFERSTMYMEAENNETVCHLLMRYYTSYAKSDRDY